MIATARIAIVGAGLSGLYAAYLLEQQGIGDYVLLEAREVLGGRIASAALPDRRDRFDLGPTWFWPQLQPALDRLVRELSLASFAQHDAGDMMIERSRAQTPMRVRGFVNSPASMRLVGGMEALTDALRRRLTASRVIPGQAVRRIRGLAAHVELDSEDASGQLSTWRVAHVLLAAPPRVAMDSIAFAPAVPQQLARQWCATATWMAPHAKYVAVYDRSLWREQGLSGEARSAAGPLGEIHDASMPGGSAALFGFFAIPSEVRRRVDDDVLRAQCRAQLGRLFGPKAAQPKADFIKDWALDPYTATQLDLDGDQQRAGAPPVTAASGPWAGRLTGIASEWSPRFPGYLAGAIDAAHEGVRDLLHLA